MSFPIRYSLPNQIVYPSGTYKITGFDGNKPNLTSYVSFNFEPEVANYSLSNLFATVSAPGKSNVLINGTFTYKEDNHFEAGIKKPSGDWGNLVGYSNITFKYPQSVGMNWMNWFFSPTSINREPNGEP